LKIKISQTAFSKDADPVSEALHQELQSSIRDSFKIDHEKFDSMKTRAGNLIIDILKRFPFVPPTPGYHPALDYNYLELNALAGKHFLYRMKRVEAEFLLKYLQAARFKSKLLFELKCRLRAELDAFMYTLKLIEEERLYLKELFDKAHQAQLTKTQLHFERWAHQLMLHAVRLNRRKDALDQEISIERVRIENLKSSLSSSRTNLFFPANLSFLQLLETCPLPIAVPLMKQFQTYQNEYKNSHAASSGGSTFNGKSFDFLHSKFFSKGIWDELWKAFSDTKENSLRSALVKLRNNELMKKIKEGEPQAEYRNKLVYLSYLELGKDHSKAQIKSILSNENTNVEESYLKKEFAHVKLDIHANPYLNGQILTESNFVRYENKSSSLHAFKSQEAKIHFKNLQENIDLLYKFNLSHASIQSQTQETLQLNMSKSTLMEGDKASLQSNLRSMQNAPKLDSEGLLKALQHTKGSLIARSVEMEHIIRSPAAQPESENIVSDAANEIVEDSPKEKKLTKA
jgi:hypothetical protein